jgi:hypothetical protein
MPTEIEWPAIALRLALTAVASRRHRRQSRRAGSAGWLTKDMLVALAAAISMIQVICCCRASENRATHLSCSI